MCTVISHAVVGLALGSICVAPPRRRSFWVAAALLPMLPDADYVLHEAGVPYEHMFGHRGFSHSPYFALFAGLLVLLLFFPVEARDFKRRGWRCWGFFSLAIASHGILDGMTNPFLGHGIGYLAPFSDARHFLPWHLFPTPPLSLNLEWGFHTLKIEMIRLWLPAFGLALLVFLFRRWRRSRKPIPPPA